MLLGWLGSHLDARCGRDCLVSGVRATASSSPPRAFPAPSRTPWMYYLSVSGLNWRRRHWGLTSRRCRPLGRPCRSWGGGRGRGRAAPPSARCSAAGRGCGSARAAATAWTRGRPGSAASSGSGRAGRRRADRNTNWGHTLLNGGKPFQHTH